MKFWSFQQPAVPQPTESLVRAELRQQGLPAAGSSNPANHPGYTRQRAMAEQLLANSQGPVSGWGEALGKLAQTGVGAWLNRRADQGEAADNAAYQDAMMGALGSGTKGAAMAELLMKSGNPRAAQMGMSLAMAQALEGPGEKWTPLTDEQEAGMGLPTAGSYLTNTSGDVKSIYDAPKPTGPESSLAKLKADLNAGLIDQPTYDAAIAKETHISQPQGPATWSDITDDKGNVIGQRSSTGQVNYFSDYPGKPAAVDPKLPNMLRDEFNTLTKDFRVSQDAYQKILKSSKSATGAGDMSIVYGFIKMLDPNSAVREGEYATADNAQSIPENIRSMYNRAIDGQLMAPEVRAKFVAEAGNLYQVQLQGYNRFKQNYTSIAERSQVNPADVIVDYSDPAIGQPQVDLGTGGQVTPDIGFRPPPGAAQSQYQQKYGITPKAAR